MNIVLKLVMLMLLFAPAASGTPIQFIPNQGQWNAPFEFKATIHTGYAVFFEKNAMTFLLSDYSQLEDGHHKQGTIITPASLMNKEENEAPQHRNGTINNHAYRIEFVNATTAGITGEDVYPHYHNYFLGNDPSRWKGHVNLFAGLRYQQIYSGIDLTYKSNDDNKAKYEFIVAPHASPQSIQMRYEGASPDIAANGNLIIKTSLGDVVEYAPYTFQVIDNKKVGVPSHYVLNNGIVSFAFPDGYNPSHELVIDPIVDYRLLAA